MFSPDSESYWGFYFKYRESCMCAPSGLGADIAAGRRCCVRLGAWVLRAKKLRQLDCNDSNALGSMLALFFTCLM